VTPREIGEVVRRDVPLLRTDERIGSAVTRIVEAALPALPVVDEDERFQGIFGEREFFEALFPGYLKELGYAGFVTKAVEAELEKRSSCLADPVDRYMNTEHIDVGPDYSDAQLAEIFLHHRVLIVPITDEDRVQAIVTRSDFFRVLVERFQASVRDKAEEP
jgi:CBS domain-containing protein